MNTQIAINTIKAGYVTIKESSSRIPKFRTPMEDGVYTWMTNDRIIVILNQLAMYVVYSHKQRTLTYENLSERTIPGSVRGNVIVHRDFKPLKVLSNYHIKRLGLKDVEFGRNL